MTASATTEAPAATATATPEVNLRRPLAARLEPLLGLLAALLATGAPVAHHVVAAAQLRRDGATLAREVARTVALDAEQRPVLWRYDTIKLVEHLRAYRAHPGVARIEVADESGGRIDPSPTRPGERAPVLLWERAPVRVRGREVAQVWVAMSVDALRRRSLALLGLFGATAAVLAGLVAWIALRAARDAERRIAGLVDGLERSRADLARLARGLEADVEARTAQLARANAALRAEEQRLRDTAARAVALQETERRAIGRDLHDSVGQALTAIRILAQLAEGGATSGDGAARPGLMTRVVATTDAALEELRRALARLGPAVLREVGLAEALRRLADDVEERDGVDVVRDVDPDVATSLEPAVEVACYRIVQEALTNVSRYARARNVTVRLAPADEGRAVAVEVVDDGEGFDPAGAERGHGIVGMRERAELLGGRFEVESAKGEGTRVRAEIPSRPRSPAATGAG